METNHLIDGLRDRLGDVGVLTGDLAEPWQNDYRGIFGGHALAIARPASTEEVAETVIWCAENGLAIVSQGGNTGLSGGGTHTEDRPGIVLNLGRMNRIESTNPNRSTMTVQAGVTIEAMHKAAAAAGLLFAPDWGARGTATIGGGIATDAGGINVLRYGNMRDQVLGLEAVLPDGRIWNGLRSLRKDSSGYDLKQLFIGSEGTLGVITRAVVKLHPATPFTTSALASLTDLSKLGELYDLALRAAPNLVTAFELIPEVGLGRVCEVFELNRPGVAQSDFYVLLKLASAHPTEETIADLLTQAADAGLISDAAVASTREQDERLWMIRDELTPKSIYPETQAVGLKLDTAVPTDRMVEFHDAVQRVTAEVAPYALAYGFGHVGDGNIHMMILPPSVDDVAAFLEQKPELLDCIDRLTFEMGGTLSAEHGVGRDLRQRIVDQKPGIEWEMMTAIKSAFDPTDLMNPGVLLPDPSS